MLRNSVKSARPFGPAGPSIPNARFRLSMHAAFPLSDHADFPDLIELVKRVQPKKVYTLARFAAEVAQNLCRPWLYATALSEMRQLPWPCRRSSEKSAAVT